MRRSLALVLTFLSMAAGCAAEVARGNGEFDPELDEWIELDGAADRSSVLVRDDFVPDLNIEEDGGAQTTIRFAKGTRFVWSRMKVTDIANLYVRANWTGGDPQHSERVTVWVKDIDSEDGSVGGRFTQNTSVYRRSGLFTLPPGRYQIGFYREYGNSEERLLEEDAELAIQWEASCASGASRCTLPISSD